MITTEIIKKNKIVLLFLAIIFMKKMIHQRLFIGIILGYLLCFSISNQEFMTTFSNSISSLTSKKGDSYHENSGTKKNKLLYVNKDIKLKRAYIDIRRYEGQNYLAINKSLKHMERFMKIRHNFHHVDNTTQFYSLAEMERTKSITSLKTLLLHSPKKYSRKMTKIIAYIDKVSTQYLYNMAQINNDRWNEGDTFISPIYTEELDTYYSDDY
tara:strand:+ start:121 stop:756 length:636 start_codon:yes stop_codon:yes gene_type:complete